VIIFSVKGGFWEQAMMLRVRERGDEVLIDLDGVAGRQQIVLQALTECRQIRASESEPHLVTDVSVRAGANAMRISLKGRAGLRYETQAIYQCLRSALLNRLSAPAAAAAAR
jgi:hypothetical protein